MAPGDKIYFVTTSPRQHVVGILVWQERAGLLVAVPASASSGTPFEIARDGGTESDPLVSVAFTWVPRELVQPLTSKPASDCIEFEHQPHFESLCKYYFDHRGDRIDRSQLRSRSPCTSPRVTSPRPSPRTSPRSFLRGGRCHLEPQAALLLQQTAHPSLRNLPQSALHFTCSSFENEDNLQWNSKVIQEWKSKLVGNKGRADPTGLLHCLVSSLAETYRLQVSRAQADGKRLCLTVPSAKLAPPQVLADIVFASLSAAMHSQQGFQLTQIAFLMEDMNMCRPLVKALERLHAGFRGVDASLTCTCNRCGGAHGTLECPHFVQSAEHDPDAQLRAEATCRGSTPNAALYTPREESEPAWVEAMVEAILKKFQSEQPTAACRSELVQCQPAHQQIPHGDTGLLSPKDCNFRASKFRKKMQEMLDVGNVGCDQDMPEQTQSSEPGNCQSCDAKAFEFDSAKRCNVLYSHAQSMCRPQPCSASATPLQILGLQVGFSEQDLRAAYKRAVLLWHPDRPVWQGSSQTQLQDAADMFRRIKEAYESLCKKDSRLKV